LFYEYSVTMRKSFRATGEPCRAAAYSIETRGRASLKRRVKRTGRKVIATGRRNIKGEIA